MIYNVNEILEVKKGLFWKQKICYYLPNIKNENRLVNTFSNVGRKENQWSFT